MCEWAYRIMRVKNPVIPGIDDDYTYGVVECFFDEYGKSNGWTDFVKPMGESPAEVVESLIWMLQGAWAGAFDQEEMRERLLTSTTKNPKSGKFYNSEEFKEVMARDQSPAEEVPVPDPITILVRRTPEGHYLGQVVQKVNSKYPRTFEANTLDEVEEKAKQMIWGDLEPIARPEIQLCFAWERFILPSPPKSK